MPQPLPLATRARLEDLTAAQTAECLGICEATVRRRLSRANPYSGHCPSEIDMELRHVFAFSAERCERMVEAVLARITKDANRT